MKDILSELMLGFAHYPAIIFISLAGSLFYKQSGFRLFFQTACLLTFDIILNVALKGTFRIPLPPELSKIYFAFPSGHMQFTTAFYCWWLIFIPFWWFRIAVGIILMGIAAGMLHFHYHTLLDIIGGFVTGLLLVMVYYHYLNLNSVVESRLKRTSKLVPWIFLLTANLLQIYNIYVYAIVSFNAIIAYYLLSIIILLERTISLNGKLFSLWIFVKPTIMKTHYASFSKIRENLSISCRYPL